MSIPQELNQWLNPVGLSVPLLGSTPYPQNPRPLPRQRRPPTRGRLAGGVVVGKSGRAPAGPCDNSEPSTRRWSLWGRRGEGCLIVYPLSNAAAGDQIVLMKAPYL